MLRVDSLALWKIINDEDAVLIPKNRGENFSSGYLHSEFLGAGWAATSLIVALSPGHSDITRVRPWSPIATGNRLDRTEKNSKSCSDDWHSWRFLSAFSNFGTHFAESFRMSKSSWLMDPTRSRDMPSCSAIDLAEIQRSSKISSWIWSIISGAVTVLGRPGRDASQVEKSPRLNWATQFLTVAYDGDVPLMFLSEWRKFPSAACLVGWKKLDDSSRRLTCFLSVSVTRKDLQFITRTDPLSNDTNDSVLRHREVGRAKDLSAPPRAVHKRKMYGLALCVLARWLQRPKHVHLLNT